MKKIPLFILLSLSIDCGGGVSKEAHERAMQRIIQAGVIPVTWEQVMYEWQRDWARVETADRLREVIARHTGAFGQGVIYAKEMFGAQEEDHCAGPADPARRTIDPPKTGPSRQGVHLAQRPRFSTTPDRLGQPSPQVL